MEWIARHSDSISAVTGLGTLLVWLIYLQVFVSSYRRQLRATLHITRGPGVGFNARCLLTNMSSGPLFVASVQVRIQLETNQLIAPVTDRLRDERSEPHELLERTRQGPLGSGETRDLGTFADLVGNAAFSTATETSEMEKRLRSVMIEVVGLYGSEDLPVGARRQFDLLDRGRTKHLQGRKLRTTQIRKRRDREALVEDMRRDR